jgi:hypothetical protein
MRVAVYPCVGLLQVAGWLCMYQEVRKSIRFCAQLRLAKIRAVGTENTAAIA